jgi:acyl-coenzyme A thioesterase PaaI-like protein
MSDLVAAIRRAKDTGDFSELVAAVPYWRFLGISAELSEGEMLGKLSFSEPLIGNPVLPALHGGTIGALLESTAVFELFWQAETVVLPKTINITVAYLRSGRPQDTWAKAVITKHGRRVASVRVEAWQEDRARPIASASANFLVTPVEC